MNQATWDEMLQYLPWALCLALIAGILYSMRQQASIVAEKLSHKFGQMGLWFVVEGLDSFSRRDRAAEAAWVRKLIAKYGGDEGPMQFVYDVFYAGIDDLLADTKFGPLAIARIEETVFKTLFDDAARAKFLIAAQSALAFGHKDASEFFTALQSAKPDDIRMAFKDFVNDFGDPGKIESTTLANLAVAVPALIKNVQNETALEKIRDILIEAFPTK